MRTKGPLDRSIATCRSPITAVELMALDHQRRPPPVTAQFGHARILTTLGIYTHAIPASHREAIAAVEERLFAQLLSNVLESRTRSRALGPQAAVAISTRSSIFLRRMSVVFMQVDSKCAYHSGGTSADVSGKRAEPGCCTAFF